MTHASSETIRQAVRAQYGTIAQADTVGCGCQPSSCCGAGDSTTPDVRAIDLVADQSIDVILSNCVINLSPDKAQVLREAFRVLKPGGRLAIADMVATAPLPEAVRQDLTLYTGCMAGAAVIEDLDHMLAAAGFTAIRIQPRGASSTPVQEPGREREASVVSATLEATKP